MDTYDDIKDPLEHLENFKGWMNFYAFFETVRYEAFQMILTHKANIWQCILKPNTIGLFVEFGK